MFPTQDERSISVETPLGKDVLLLHTFSYREELGRPFELTLEMQSINPLIDFSKILGQKVTVTVNLPLGGYRYFNGYVRDFEQGTYDSVSNLASYRAVVVPWLSLLKLPTDCRTYLDKTTPDIIEDVFRRYGFTAYRFNLTYTYYPRKFCVQYQESAFDFVSRLMEFAGIYCYFEHEKGEHTMVLCDSPAAHKVYNADYAAIPYRPSQGAPIGSIQDWSMRQTLSPGTVDLDDYNYELTSEGLIHETKYISPFGFAHGAYEHYEAPGGYYSGQEGDSYAKIRHEEMSARQSIQQGEGEILGIAAGYQFALLGFLRPDQNVNYLTTSVNLKIVTPTWSSLMPDAITKQTQSCSFTSIPASMQYRSGRITSKPCIPGLQTAVVVGPVLWNNKLNGPFTDDQLGSVYVQFRWDRHHTEGRGGPGGIGNVESSIPVRVARPSAGKDYGSMFIPHVGDEVLVVFEGGDPDRPVIVGSVYNSMNLPPLSMPGHKQCTYVSDVAGNAICFYSIPLKEEISIFANYNGLSGGNFATYGHVNTKIG